MFNGDPMRAAAIYFLTKNKQMHIIKYLSISIELNLGLGWILALSLLAKQVCRRIFFNYQSLRQNQWPPESSKKIMVKVPHARKLCAPQRKVNFWSLQK